MPATQDARLPVPSLLLCSDQEDSALAMQAAVFRDSGYPVSTSATSPDIEQALRTSPFDVLVLNHSLSFADRKLLAGKAKEFNPESGVLVLHHSGSLGNPHVDLAIDSRLGANAMLRALDRLQGMMHARSHHLDFSGTYFVVADSERNYTFVIDAVCRLLGYDRALMLELRIAHLVDGATVVADPLFQQFVADGSQTGSITLRHRSGKRLRVKYWAKVESDGCMLARWEPVETAKTTG